jgi:hypothetical protein
MRDFVDRADTLLCSLEQERAAFPTIQPTLTAADCVPSGLDADLMGKVVIIKSEVLSPEYRFADHQLKIVTGGFGSYPDARGNAVFCKDLYSDRESRFERYDIAGVADTNRIPEWANRKLAYLEALKEPGVFEYGGYHFKPLRQFEKRDGGFSDQMRRVSSDRQLGISTYAWKKTDYSYDAFYSASGYSQADVFRCLENGRLYVPCDGELFQYTEPPAKEQAKSAPTQAKKPAERAPDESQKPKSILGDLDAATAEAAECNAARQVGDKPKKRGELEVD